MYWIIQFLNGDRTELKLTRFLKTSLLKQSTLYPFLKLTFPYGQLVLELY